MVIIFGYKVWWHDIKLLPHLRNMQQRQTIVNMMHPCRSTSASGPAIPQPSWYCLLLTQPLDTGNCTTHVQTLSHKKEGLQWGPWPEGIKDTPVQGHSCPSPCWILSDAATLQISFSSCSSLSFSLPGDSSVNLLHATLHLRFYFQASHPKTKVLWNKILFWNYIMNKMLEKRCAWYISTNYLLNVIPVFPKDTCGSSTIK